MSRSYKHWLKINGQAFDEAKQYKEILDYLVKYPSAKATMFLLEYQCFDRIVLLECDQNYDDLDMDVNSGSHNLRRLTSKPKTMINDPREFAAMDYISKKIEKMERKD